MLLLRDLSCGGGFPKRSRDCWPFNSGTRTTHIDLTKRKAVLEVQKMGGVLVSSMPGFKGKVIVPLKVTFDDLLVVAWACLQRKIEPEKHSYLGWSMPTVKGFTSAHLPHQGWGWVWQCALFLYFVVRILVQVNKGGFSLVTNRNTFSRLNSKKLSWRG
jgi:hypothetical protein